MKLYILADRLNKSLDEVFKAIEKLNLNIKSPEQNLTHEEVMEITKYFAEKRRFLFFILLWGYILSFLSAFSFLFKKRSYFYGICTGITVFTFVAINAPNQSNEITVTDITSTTEINPNANEGIFSTDDTTTQPDTSVETSIFITDGTSTTTTVPPTTTTTTVPPTTTTTTTTTTTVPPTTTTTTTVPPVDILVNGSFENYEGDPIGDNSYKKLTNQQVPGWTIERLDGSNLRFEVWESGHRGIESVEGSHHLELNSTAEGSIYQDVSVSPGDQISWSFWHRGRAGTDTVKLSLGAPGSEVDIGEYSTSTSWIQYSGTYTVPDGVTTLRVRITHVSTARFPGEGNLLDDIKLINNY
jgi:cytoskeletal protein RodZ